LNEQQLVDEAVKHLKKAYKGKKIVVKNYIVTSWEKEEFSQGSYPYFTTYSSPADCEELFRPIFNTVYFAGDAMYADYFGCCHGAYITGIDAAKNLAHSLANSKMKFIKPKM